MSDRDYPAREIVWKRGKRPRKIGLFTYGQEYKLYCDGLLVASYMKQRNHYIVGYHVNAHLSPAEVYEVANKDAAILLCIKIMLKQWPPDVEALYSPGHMSAQKVGEPWLS